MFGRFRWVNIQNLPRRDRRTLARRITGVQSSPRADCFLSGRPTSTRNSAPSINPRVNCFGKRPCPSPATPPPPPTKSMAVNSSSSPRAAAKIPSHHPVVSTSPSPCRKCHQPRRPVQTRRTSLGNRVRIDRHSQPAFPASLRRQLVRSEEHTLNSSHLVISYAVFCLKKK